MPVYTIVDKRDTTSLFVCEIVFFSVEFLAINLCKNMVFKAGKKVLVYYIVSGTDHE
jgi:hypothetical protein